MLSALSVRALRAALYRVARSKTSLYDRVDRPRNDRIVEGSNEDHCPDTNDPYSAKGRVPDGFNFFFSCEKRQKPDNVSIGNESLRNYMPRTDYRKIITELVRSPILECRACQNVCRILKVCPVENYNLAIDEPLGNEQDETRRKRRSLSGSWRLSSS